MRRIYKNLVPHNIIYISFEFVLTGGWQPSDWFAVDLDGVSSIRWTPASQALFTPAVHCGSLSPGLNSYLIGKAFHTADSITVTVSFSVTLASVLNNPAVGIRDVTLIEKFSQPGDSQGFYLSLPNSAGPNSTHCGKGQYFVPPASCPACSTATCGLCTGFGNTDCLRSAWATYSDGNGFSSCASNCMFCKGPNANDCIQCNPPFTLDIDNICKMSCSLPYQAVGPNFLKCLLPCNSDQYLYWNNTCQDSCNFPLQIDTQGEQCIYPCNKAYAQFLYWDGSCQLTCPFIQRNENGYAFCDMCPLGYYLYPDNLCRLDCTYPYIIQRLVYCSLDLTHSDIRQAAVMSKVSDAGGLALGIGAAAASFFNPRDPSAFVLASLAKMLYYTRYMNIKYPPRLQNVLDLKNASQPSVEFLRKAQSLLKNHLRKYPLPGKFDHYQLHSSFLVNFFQPIIVLTALLVVVLLSLLLNSGSKQATRPALEKIKDTLRWSLPVTLYISEYDGVILYASLEFRTSNTFYSFLSSMSFLVSLGSITMVIFISIKAIKTIKALRLEIRNSTEEQRSQAVNNFMKEHRSFQVFYVSFRDSNLLQQSFFIIFTSRLIAFHIIIAALIDYPFVQAILILLMNISMFLILCITYPIKHKLRLMQYILQEGLLLVVNICVLIVACLDLTGKESYSTRKAAGEIFLYCNSIISMLGPAVLVLMVVEKLISLRRKEKVMEAREVVITNTNAKDTSMALPQQSHGANNESNIKLNQSGADQSLIYDISLGQTDLNSISQTRGKMTATAESSQADPQMRLKHMNRGLGNNSNKVSRQSNDLQQTSVAGLNQLEAQKTSSELTYLDISTKQGEEIFSLNNQSALSNETPNALDKIKKRDNVTYHPSIKAQHEEYKQSGIIEYDYLLNLIAGIESSSHNIRLGSNKGISGRSHLKGHKRTKDLMETGMGTKTPEIENSWLRMNKNRQYYIRDPEPYHNNFEQSGVDSLKDDDRYIKGPTLGNHSGIINLLKIRKPNNLD